MLQYELRDLVGVRDQAKNLQEELDTLKGLQTLLTGSSRDVKKILDSAKDPAVLAAWVEGLKRYDFIATFL